MLAAEEAERVALAALAWLADDPARIGAFLAATGASAEELRGAAGRPEFLGFVLDHLLADEGALLAFAAASGMAPDRPARARAALPGGDAPHWT
jgi:hypothetical protein